MDEFIKYLPYMLLGIIALFFIGAEIIKTWRVWKDERQERLAKMQSQMQREADLRDEFKKIHDRFDTLENVTSEALSRLAAVEERAKDLTESDKNDIRAWIVEQYHKFYVHQGWIDAFSADTIDKRYEDYKKEGGNSYIEQLMDRLHTLPMDPDRTNRDEE